jgi:DNA-directed RNA polymerase specialized sigma24 family protein
MRKSALLNASTCTSIGPSPNDDDFETEKSRESSESSETYYPLFIALAWGFLPTSCGIVEYEDVAHEAFLKFWLLYDNQPIRSPKAYIRRIVYTVMIDMIRKYRPHFFQALPVDEDGELREGYLLTGSTVSSDQNNPEWLVVEREELQERMAELMHALHNLHARQQAAAVCHLWKKVDDVLAMLDVLQKKGITCEWEWPAEPVERQRLQASFSPAKRNIAQSMGVDLDDYE